MYLYLIIAACVALYLAMGVPTFLLLCKLDGRPTYPGELLVLCHIFWPFLLLLQSGRFLDSVAKWLASLVTVCVLVFSLAPSPCLAETTKNFGYTPNKAEGEGLLRSIREKRQREQEEKDAAAVREWHRRNPDTPPPAPAPTVVISLGSRLVLNLCYILLLGAGVTLLTVNFGRMLQVALRSDVRLPDRIDAFVGSLIWNSLAVALVTTAFYFFP